MTDREAMLLALDALENHTAIKHPQQMHYRDTAIEALRQALEQPEQEPVAWVLHRELFWPYEYEVISENGDNAIPLYTAPPKREWVGLTETERINLEILMIGQIQVAGLNVKGISNAIRAVEQVLKERNT